MGVLLGTALFGSVARGDDDELSDLDVLALVQNGAGVVADAEVLATLPAKVAERAATISWYGADRYLGMHRTGGLFSWHLFLDGRILHDPSGLLGRLGAPTPYCRALADVDAFIEIAADLPSQLGRAACNAVYEMGVLYVCLRNVAMSGSASLSGRPDFTRMAPYHLAGCPTLKVPEQEYHLSMLCRLAGQRGLPLPGDITPGRVLKYHEGAFDWMLAIRGLLDRN
jgi:hypothetical protein